MSLLMGNTGWETVKQRVRHPLLRDKFESFCELFAEEISMPLLPEKKYIIGEKRQAAHDLTYLTEIPLKAVMLSRITGKELDIDNFRRFIESLLNRTSWMHPSHVAIYEASKDERWHNCTADLRTASTTVNLSLILDWGADILPGELVRGIKEQLRRRGTDEILDNIGRGTYWSGWYISNWCIALMEGLGVGAAFEKDSDPRSMEKLIEAEKRTCKFLDAQGKDSGYHEGLAYAGCLSHVISLSLALEYAGMDSLFSHPFMQNAGDFFMQGICPGFTGIANFSDASYRGSSMPWLSFLAKKYNRPDWQWAARGMLEKTGCLSWKDIIWFDPEAEFAVPSEADRARLFGNVHFAFVRDSWKDDARYLVMPAGSAYFGHRHSDFGSFILNQFGERQIADSGTHYYYTETPWHLTTHAHGTLIINGKGQNGWLVKKEYPLLLQKIDPLSYGDNYALIDFFSSDNISDIIVESVHGAYPQGLCESFVRAVVSLRDGPVVIMDEVIVPAGAHLEFRFISAGKVQIQRNTFIIEQERSICRGVVAYPEKTTITAGEKEREAHEEENLIPICAGFHLEPGKTRANFVAMLCPACKGSEPDYTIKVLETGSSMQCIVTGESFSREIVFDIPGKIVKVL